MLTTIKFDDMTGQTLNTIAKQANKPLEQLLQDIIADYLEDTQDAALASTVMDNLINGSSSTITLQQWSEQLDDMDD